MPRIRHPEDGMVFACPACDSMSNLHRREQDNIVHEGGECVCYTCQTTFDEPVERESNMGHGHGGRQPKAFKQLVEGGDDA